MITEKDLQEAIAECEGKHNPNANTCIMLAAFYTIRQHMFGGASNQYSYAPPPVNVSTVYESDSEFGKMVSKIDYHDLLTTMDELMVTLSVVNPRLYSSVMRKLNDTH